MNLWQQHIEYLKDNPEGYWFKRKLYGCGSTLATKESWTVTGIYILMIGLYVWQVIDISVTPSIKNLLFILLVTILLVTLTWKKGKFLKWQWGKDLDNKDEK